MSDALVRKVSVKDANAEYVQKLRVSNVATDQEIQTALHKLFQSSPQGISVQGPQDQQIQRPQDSGPQGSDKSTNDEPRHPIIAATSVSRIQVDESFKNSLNSLLHQEAPYAEILKDLLGGTKQIKQNNLIFKHRNGLLLVHD